MAPTKANCSPKSPTNLLDCLHINNDTGNTRQKYPSLGPKQNGVPTTAVTGDTVDRPKLPARGTVCTQTEVIQPSKKHSDTPQSGWIPQLYPIKMRLGPASAIEYYSTQAKTCDIGFCCGLLITLTVKVLYSCLRCICLTM